METRHSGLQRARLDLAENLLRKITELLLEFGTTRTELREILDKISTRASKARPLRRGISKFEWWAYARVLSFWHQEPTFLDQAGNPRALTLAGKSPNFRLLTKRSLPGAAPREVVQALESLGAVRRIARGRFLPTGRNLIIKARTRMNFVRTIEMLEALSSTMHLNLFQKPRSKRGSGLFERSAVCENFDLKYLRDLDRLVRQHGQSLLELIDEWLSRHETSGKQSARAGHVGVGLYLFARTKRKDRPHSSRIAP